MRGTIPVTILVLTECCVVLHISSGFSRTFFYTILDCHGTAWTHVNNTRMCGNSVCASFRRDVFDKVLFLYLGVCCDWLGQSLCNDSFALMVGSLQRFLVVSDQTVAEPRSWSGVYNGFLLCQTKPWLSGHRTKGAHRCSSSNGDAWELDSVLSIVPDLYRIAASEQSALYSGSQRQERNTNQVHRCQT